MAIEIDNDYPVFRVTHTLHQLVDKLNEYSDVVDANTRLIDSALNETIGVFDHTGSINADSNLTITADNLHLSVDSGFGLAYLSSNRFVQNVENNYLLDVGNSITLSSGQDTANVILRSEGTTYGVLRNTGGQLEILSGALVAQTMSSDGTTFSGEIVMPTTGDASPETDNKTVHGAINELHDEINDIVDTEIPRIGTLETDVSNLQTSVSNLQTSLSSVGDRVTTLEALNIANRLTTIESQIVQINDRLNILDI